MSWGPEKEMQKSVPCSEEEIRTADSYILLISRTICRSDSMAHLHYDNLWVN